MKHVLKDFSQKYQQVKKILTAPKKIYDSDGNLKTTKQNSKVFNLWLKSAIESGDFCKALSDKYNSYRSTKPKFNLNYKKEDDIPEIDDFYSELAPFSPIEEEDGDLEDFYIEGEENE